LDKPPVVVVSGVRWDFLWQRHHIIATLFARAGYPTVFVETTGVANPRPNKTTLRKVASRIRRSRGEQPSGEKGLAVYAPLAVPPKGRIPRWLNRRLFVPRMIGDLRDLAGPSPVVVAYPPTQTTLELIRGLHPRLVLYDCSDDYAHFPGAPKDMAITEHELLRRADLVSCTSTRLLERMRTVRPDAFLSGPAVDYERFAILQDLQDTRSDRGVRTVCFFGHVSRERTDFSALRAIAGAGFEVRIIGALGRVDKGVMETRGISYKGEVPHAQLPAALAGVDAFVLPYKLNGLTRGISPAKTYECLATGKPVVAAPLSALEELAGHVYLARSPEDYVAILRSLEGLETEEKRRARAELACENSWEERFRGIEEALWRVL
jgi:glycosyltransferase involved in cell wall biosynthesis